MGGDREFEGKDLEEALDAAARALGVAQEALHYEMLEPGRRGLLGLGVRNVRIRVKPPIDTELARETPGPPAGKPARRGEGEPPAEALPEASPAVVQDVERTVVQIVRGIGLEVEVAAKPDDGGVRLELKGPDKNMLTAKNAELLSAIQLLLNRMSRRAWPGVGRIRVSCNGRPRSRDEQLVAMVRKVAKQVARTGKTRRLHPMNGYERRLVHLTVREFPGLTSSSDGSGALKRVRISKVQNRI